MATMTPAKLAKKAHNMAAAADRLKALQASQQREKLRRENMAKLLTRANAPAVQPTFLAWLDRVNMTPTPGSAALFFALYPGIEQPKAEAA